MDTKEAFRECRRVSTPIVLWSGPDYRAIIKKAQSVRITSEDGDPPAVVWDLATGHRPVNSRDRGSQEAAGRLGAGDETQLNPPELLRRATALPGGAILYMVCPNNEMLSDPGNAAVAQGIANLRDLFKSDRRTLVLVGDRSLQAPAFVAEDIPILRDELPDDDEIRAVIESVYESVNRGLKSAGEQPYKQDKANVDRAVSLCRGLTRFTAEDGVARNIKKAGINLDNLAELQKEMVESATSRALTFEKETWTFDDIGGLKQFRSYMTRLFAGAGAPDLIVRWDEIDKSITSASTGKVADNTGTSQDQLRVVLQNMEENGYMGMMLLGSPGAGKSLATICTGNTFKRKCAVFDPGMCKDSLVGASEKKIRAVMDVIKSIGRKRVLFLATANRLDTLPAELQRRFKLGNWFFDIPTPEECQTILKIQAKKFGLDLAKNKKLPSMEGWVGSDIRNCCETAWRLSPVDGPPMSLLEASELITLASKAAAADIEKIRALAETAGFLCANHPGPYRRPERPGGRAVAVN